MVTIVCSGMFAQIPVDSIKLNKTIQRYYGPNIRFTFGNSMELTTLNTFKVNVTFWVLNLKLI